MALAACTGLGNVSTVLYLRECRLIAPALCSVAAFVQLQQVGRSWMVLGNRCAE